ncbi:MAG: zinc metallopeptidase [Thiomargarita sp.]|nr:zinc metallopeptidase [Thiomargarita sp.]
MPILILLLFLVAVVFLPQIWAKKVLKKYSQSNNNLPMNGSQFAQHLLEKLDMSHVKLEMTKLGDHYDPTDKTVRLSQANWENNSLTAITTAAHEVGHALQDYTGYLPLHLRTHLVVFARIAEKIGAWLLILSPLVMIVLRIPSAGILFFLGGFLSLGTAVVVHLVTLPVEFNASFKRALPILAQGNYISVKEQRAARKILTACALTYVAASLANLLNLGQWIAILFRR